MGKIVTFGEIILRLTPNGFYRFFQNDQLQASFGGAEANVAVSLSNFGEEVSFVSKVPEHAIGQGAINSLRSFGVDTSYISRGGDRLGIYYLERGANQRSSICIYDRAGSSLAGANRGDFDWDSIFSDADWLHFTGITPALGGQVPWICEDACIAAKKHNVQISCDLNYRAKLWTKESANKVLSHLCQYVDVCIANEEDAKNVFGIEAVQTDIDSGDLKRESYYLVAKQLLQRYSFRSVAISLRTSHSATVNEWEGLLYTGDRVFMSESYRFDSIVDRIGGGDSFAAGLIYAMRRGMSGQQTIDFAVAASALKHSIEGDFNRVSVAEVEALMKGHGSGRVQR